jgi:putative methyltransferase (TIGR04325 family)
MALTPPFLLRSALALRERVTVRRFDSWAEASAVQGNYNDDVINRFRQERSALNGGRAVRLDKGLLYAVAAAMGGKVSITDYGGATGDFGRALLDAMPDISYCVVENPVLVKLMPLSAGGVTFSNEMPNECDVFFTSSTLQYLPNPYEVLERGFDSARRAIVLERNTFSNREVIRLQRSSLFANGAGKIPPGYKDVPITYPHRTIIEQRIHEIAARHGAHLVARLPEESDVFGAAGVNGMKLVFFKK